MIKIRFFLVFLLEISLYASNISHIKWYGDYKYALKLAKSQNKLLMVVVRKDDSKECKKLFATTFTNQPYIKKLNQKYISVIVTYENNTKSNYPIEMYYTDIFPTLFFLDPRNGLFVDNPIYGYVSPKDFTQTNSTLLLD